MQGGSNNGETQEKITRALKRVNHHQVCLNSTSNEATTARSRIDSPSSDGEDWAYQHPLLKGSKEAKRLIAWMRQKHELDQDIFLVGGGGPLRRWLAFAFCNAIKQDFEYIALTRDTTESGSKQFQTNTSLNKVI